MNSLDDFARLRPDEDAVTTSELDDIWDRLVGDEPATTHDRPEPAPSSQRRFAFIGAAAVLALGVVAIASFADRAEAPPAVGDTSVGVEPPPATTIVTGPGVESDQPTDAGEPPLWGVVEAGWTLAAFDDHTDGPLDTVRLFSGPGGLATSWVAVVSGMSEPLAPIGYEPADAVEGSSPISTQRVATQAGSMAVIAGGVSDEQAMSLFLAVQDGGAPPDGFVETDTADAAVRTIRYRFESEAGETIDVEVQGAGAPRYETERSAATAEEFWDATAGVDEATIAYAGEYTLLLRNGFWVSRVVTSAPSDSPTTFTRLASLVQLISPDEWNAAQPIDAPGVRTTDRLAIGDFVMLGASAQLAELGFVVDAVERRDFGSGVEVVQTLQDRDRLPRTLVVHLGSNATISEQDMSDFVELVAEVESVLLLTNTIDLDGAADNNELIIATAAAHGNISVLDWNEVSANCPGDCFFDDGVHLEPDGRDFYASLIAEAIDS